MFIIVWSLICNVYAWNDIVADLLIKGDAALLEHKIDMELLNIIRKVLNCYLYNGQVKME